METDQFIINQIVRQFKNGKGMRWIAKEYSLAYHTVEEIIRQTVSQT